MFGFREGMTYLNPAPLYHSAPQASVSLSLRLGATAVIMEHFDPEHWLALVERYRVTHCQMVPTMFMPAAAPARRGPGAATTSRRWSASCTPPLPARFRSSGP